MFLRVFRDDIIDGLQKSANIIPAKTGAAFLRTIWLKAEAGVLKIMSTDSNLEFCGAYPAQIEREGLAGVQGRSFYDLVSKLPAGEIAITAEPGKQQVLVEQGSRKYKLPANDPTWFQSFSVYPENTSVFWTGDFLQEIIDKIAFCIAEEDTMEAIACMNIVPTVDKSGGKVVEACGMNGHQFAMLRFVNDDIHAMLPHGGVLIQKKYLVELKKWLTTTEIEMSLGEKRLFFRTADKTETFSLPQSFYQYPNYNTFLAKIAAPGSSLSLDRQELIDALRRIAIFNSESNRCTNMRFGTEALELFAQGQDVGAASESMPAEFSGELDKIAFPTRNLMDILGHFASAKVAFKLTGADGPCGLTGADDPQYLVIIMPMKIVEETYYTEEAV